MKSGSMTILALSAGLQNRFPGDSPLNLFKCPEKKIKKMWNSLSFNYICLQMIKKTIALVQGFCGRRMQYTA